MCGNGGHVCPKVTHVFKNCRFYQCVNDMLRQNSDCFFLRKHGNSRENYIDGTVEDVVSYNCIDYTRNVTYHD